MLPKPSLFLISVVFAAVAVLGNDCESGKGCQPWGNSSCRQGGAMELLFLVETADDNDNPTTPPTNAPTSATGTTTTTTTTTTVAPTPAPPQAPNATTTGAAPVHRVFGSADEAAGDSKATAYPYCAKVDELQAFLLNDTGIIFNNTLAQSANLSVYGTGALPHVQRPKNGTYGRVLIYEQENAACKSKGKLGAAFVPMLVLNITFTKGLYYYVPDDSPLPVQVGFVPTCDGDRCLIGEGDVCIGNGNVKNCAKCVANEKELKSAGTSVWVSYYGTDSDNRRLTSGSENPVNFRKFAADGVLDTLSSDIADL